MKKKRTMWHVLVCFFLVCLIWGAFNFGMEKLNQRIESVIEDDFSWVVQVDGVRKENNELVLEGFAFELNEDAKTKAFDIILYDLDTGEYLFPKMEYEERKDVNNYFRCEYDYTKSGFVAKIKEKNLNLVEHDYEILLKEKQSRKPYRFSTYIEDGELMYVNPKEYKPLDVEGTDLEEIVENGVLRVYRPDVGMYVYQYEGDLYWIADENYDFSETNATRIQELVLTTQTDKLPNGKPENRWSSEDLWFYFEKYELSQSGVLRVAKRNMPEEYTVAIVKTGCFKNDWIWGQFFRMWYEVQ